MGNKHKPLSASGAKAEENARDMNASLKSSDAGTAAAAGGSSEAEGAEVAKGAEGTIGNRDEIQDYILSEPDETHREALAWFIAYMGKTHPGLKPVISYGIPTYKLGANGAMWLSPWPRTITRSIPRILTSSTSCGEKSPEPARAGGAST